MLSLVALALPLMSLTLDTGARGPAGHAGAMCIGAPASALGPALSPSLAMTPEGPEHLGWQPGRLQVGNSHCLGAPERVDAAAGPRPVACRSDEPGQRWRWKRKWVHVEHGQPLFVVRHEASGLVLEHAGTPAVHRLALGAFRPDSGRQQFAARPCPDARPPSEQALRALTGVEQ